MMAGAPDPILTFSGGRYPAKAFLEIVIEGFGGDLTQKLIAASIRLGDTAPLRRTIGRRIVYSVRKNFIEQHTPEGDRWAKLKRPRRKGHNPGTKVGLDSLRLYESIGYQLEDPEAVSIGFPHETFYGRFLDDGTVNMEARRFLGVSPDDLAAFGQFTGEHVQNAFEAA